MPKQSLTEDWQRACMLLKAEVSDLTYKSWIEELIPFRLVDDTFILQVGSAFNRTMLIGRYLGLITNALSQVYGRKIDVELLLPDECRKYEGNTEKVDSLSLTNMLNPRYSFDNFVIGNSNRFAHAASVAAAETPAEAYNPLFIYGGVGLGKTHLMHAIGLYALEHKPDAKVLYITSENFTNEMIAAIGSNTTAQFRARFRKVDYLLVDDIQFMSGREGTQEEFFHTFNTLHQENKQIVISSDKPPKDIPKLEERLSNRFAWGLIADVSKPDYETRTAILRKKAEIDKLRVPDEVIYFIASVIESNIRELEGSLTRVIAYSQLAGKDVSLDMAQEALRDILSIKDPKRITCDLIKEVVAAYFHIPLNDFVSKKRTREIAIPRQYAMYLTRHFTDLSFPRVGDAFGGRDHTTVMHAFERVAMDIANDPETRSIIEDLKKRILEK